MTDQSSDSTASDEQIFDLVDKLVELANQATDDGLDAGSAHQALMYATARYGAFIVAASSESKQDYEQDIPESRSFFMDQFRQLLNENFDDYRSHYSDYLEND